MIQVAHNHRIYSEIAGPASGPVLVLLHHGLGSVASWEEQIPVLVEAGYRVIAYDRWGYGSSDRRSGFAMPYFEEDLEDLRNILDQNGVERACLIGHSDGGTMALYFAAGHPQRVICLILIATHIYVEPKMATGLENIQTAYTENPRFRKGLGHLHGDKAREVFKNWCNGWANERVLTWDMRPLLRGIPCPTLVIQGLEDEHATPQHARDLARALPNAELWLAAGAGHMLPQDLPAAFNQKVLEFLCSIKS